MLRFVVRCALVGLVWVGASSVAGAQDSPGGLPPSTLDNHALDAATPETEAALPPSTLDNSALQTEEDGNTLPPSTLDRATIVPEGEQAPRVDVDPDPALSPERVAQAADSEEFEDGEFEDEEEGGSIFESPWFWVVAAVLVGGGVAVALLLTQGQDDYPGGEFGTVEALRSSR